MNIKEEISYLETYINENQNEALKRMTDLYKEASKNYYYDVCDAIDLWIYETKNKSIINYINEKREKEPDKYLKKKYEEWIKWIGE
ncbi:MAG: hypothetical protein LBU84_10110 [Prevotella sp.]|jgi:hypothetical protein|nr:hypothetical protein [Prevotella sp.]